MEAATVSNPIALTAAQVDALLDRLSGDDVFRELYKRDTPAALRAVGVPTEAAACIATKKLASKETFAAAREAMFVQLNGTLLFSPFLLQTR